MIAGLFFPADSKWRALMFALSAVCFVINCGISYKLNRMASDK